MATGNPMTTASKDDDDDKLDHDEEQQQMMMIHNAGSGITLSKDSVPDSPTKNNFDLLPVFGGPSEANDDGKTMTTTTTTTMKRSPVILARVFSDLDTLRRSRPQQIRISKVTFSGNRKEIKLDSLVDVSFDSLEFYTPSLIPGTTLDEDQMVHVMSKAKVYYSKYSEYFDTIEMYVPASDLFLFDRGSKIAPVEISFSPKNIEMRSLLSDIENKPFVDSISDWSEFFFKHGESMLLDGTMHFRVAQRIPFMIKPETKVNIEMFCKYPFPISAKFVSLARDWSSIFLTGVWGNPEFLTLEAGRLILGPFKCEKELPKALLSSDGLPSELSVGLVSLEQQRQRSSPSLLGEPQDIGAFPLALAVPAAMGALSAGKLAWKHRKKIKGGVKDAYAGTKGAFKGIRKSRKKRKAKKKGVKGTKKKKKAAPVEEEASEEEEGGDEEAQVGLKMKSTKKFVKKRGKSVVKGTGRAAKSISKATGLNKAGSHVKRKVVEGIEDWTRNNLID